MNNGFQKGDIVISKNGIYQIIVTESKKDSFAGIVLSSGADTKYKPGDFKKCSFIGFYKLDDTALPPFRKGDIVVSKNGVKVLVTKDSFIVNNVFHIKVSTDSFEGVCVTNTYLGHVYLKGDYATDWVRAEFKRIRTAYKNVFQEGDIISDGETWAVVLSSQGSNNSTCVCMIIQTASALMYSGEVREMAMASFKVVNTVPRPRNKLTPSLEAYDSIFEPGNTVIYENKDGKLVKIVITGPGENNNYFAGVDINDNSYSDQWLKSRFRLYKSKNEKNKEKIKPSIPELVPGMKLLYDRRSIIVYTGPSEDNRFFTGVLIHSTDPAYANEVGKYFKDWSKSLITQHDI